MSVFRYNDYRDAIEKEIDLSKKTTEKLNYSALAEATQVQKAYITRVFNKDAHFNSDQLYLASAYLKLSEEETAYLMLLLEYGRSVLNQRKKILQKQINAIQMQHRDTRKHLKAEMLNPLNLSDYNRYYLDPFVPLAHTFLSISTFAKNTKLICSKLDISENRMKAIIKTLEDLKIIKADAAAGYLIIRDHMQLVSDSPLNLPYQIFQRTNAIHKIQTQSLEDRFIFSVAFSADQKTKNSIHESFLKFLETAETLVKASDSSEIYQMNFDLFGWV